MANRFTLSAVALAMGSLLSAPTHGAVLTVNTTADDVTADDGFCTLREALVSVSSGIQNIDCSAAAPGIDDEIVFGPSIASTSTIGISTTPLEVFNGVTITGPLGESRLTIQQSANNRVFQADFSNAPEGDQLVISNLHINGGSTTSGGGAGILLVNVEASISNTEISANNAFSYGGGVAVTNGSNLTITNSLVSGNQARYGAGVYIANGSNATFVSTSVTNNITSGGAGIGGGAGINLFTSSANISNSNISGNTTSGYGGGIAVTTSSNLTIEDSSVSQNYAYDGGGFHVSDGAIVNLSDTAVTYNTATYGGGLVINDATLSVSGYDSRLYYNRAYSSGGGVFVVNSTATFKDRANITSSNSGYNGGGVYLARSTFNLVDGAYITSNDAFGFGGAVDVYHSTLLIQDATITRNTANNYNGGGLSIRGDSSVVTVQRSTIDSNRAISGFGGGVYISDALLNVSDSLISGNEVGDKGGGVMANNSGSVTLTNVTMVSNRATGDGGAINFYQAAGTTYGKIANSIIAGNFSSGTGVEIKVDGPAVIVNEGQNVLGESNESIAQAFSGFTPDASDIVANSDGNTPTPLAQILGTRSFGLSQVYYPLIANSPAISLADPSKCSDLDQKKVDRGITFFVPIKAANGNTTVVDLGSGKCDAGALAFSEIEEEPVLP